MTKLILGAPSLTGKDANDLVAATFKDAAFPLLLTVINLAAFSVSFPEISGLHIKPCTHGDEATVVVTIPDYDALQRLASSIEQVAELNHSEAMLEMVTDDGIEVEAETEAVDDEVKVEDEDKIADDITVEAVKNKKTATKG